MKEASFETADLWNQLKQAWRDYKIAKKENKEEMMRELEFVIKELKQKLGIPTLSDGFKQAA